MTVFANMLEVSCKAQANKVIAAFPDVCMTPPENPATPPGVPIPYPNFGLDGDTDKGTGSVKIGGKTVNQKNTSYFTKTSGDEAGAAAKKGVVSSKNTGKAYSQAFSMNVKAEGKNVTRFSDIQTENHGSPPNTPPFPKIGSPDPPDDTNPCKSDYDKANDACGDQESIDAACEKAGLHKKPGERAKDLGSRDGYDKDASGKHKTIAVFGATFRDNEKLIEMADNAQQDDCLAALACRLPKKSEDCPCDGQTGHHMVPASSFFNSGRGEPPKPEKGEFPISIHSKPRPTPDNYTKPPPYNAESAPCVCAEGCSNTTGSHGMMHTEMSAFVSENATSGHIAVETKKTTTTTTIQVQPAETASYEDMRDEAVRSHAVVFPCSSCDPACLKAQLDSYHCEELGMKPDQTLRAERCGKGPEEGEAARVYAAMRAQWLKG